MGSQEENRYLYILFAGGTELRLDHKGENWRECFWETGHWFLRTSTYNSAWVSWLSCDKNGLLRCCAESAQPPILFSPQFAPVTHQIGQVVLAAVPMWVFRVNEKSWFTKAIPGKNFFLFQAECAVSEPLQSETCIERSHFRVQNLVPWPRTGTVLILSKLWLLAWTGRCLWCVRNEWRLTYN